MTELRVCLLGGLALAWGQDPLPIIPGAAARSLFAYLVTYRDRPHTRDLLAGTLWPDLPDAAARHRLSQALWQIRKALSPHPVLLAEGDTVQINPALPLWLDVQELQAAGRTAEVAGSAADLERTAALYAGEFMAGYYDEWVVVERERLRDAYLGVLERLVAAYKRRGEHEKALASARRLAVEDPWREEAHREVMRLCHLLGRHAEALKQFEVCRQALDTELGCPPSPETVALAREIGIRSGLSSPPLLPSAARPAAAPSLERPDLLPLVGRRQELAELLRRAEAAAEGNGGLTVLYGEAGVGKSRLLRELADNVRWRGIPPVWGHCYELAAPLAYQPLVEVLQVGLPTLASSRLNAPWRAALASLLPELASGQPPAPALEPEEERRRLLEALSRAFLALSHTTPHLILLEDVHWMDPASLDTLRYLLPRLPGSRLLLVLSLRPDELDGQVGRALAAMEDTGVPHRLELGRLGQAETAELVERALDLARPAPHFSARLHAETEGNPFFVVETLRALVDEGLLFRDEAGAWSTPWDDSTQDYAELPLAAGVIQSIERRLDRLPASLRELLGLASVIGRWIDFRVWQSASGRDEPFMLQAGDELCARGLLVAATGEGACPPHTDYGFAHDQIRRVAYRRLMAPRRRLCHRRVAEVLSHLAPDEPADLAHHWMQAEGWAEAAIYHRLAGDRARAVYAHGEAANHYSQALAALAKPPGPADPAAEFELRLAREAVYAWQGERAAQAKELAALEALSRALDDGGPEAARRQAEVALRRARYATLTGDYPRATGAAGLAVDLALRAGDRHQEAKAHLHWGQILWHQGTYDAAQGRLEQALQLAQAAGLPTVIADCRLTLGRICLSQGAYPAAREQLTRASDLFRQAGDPRGEAEALENLGQASHLQGNYDEAARCFEQALQVSRATGDRRGEARAVHSLGSIWLHKGDHAQAESHLRRALAIAQEIVDLERQCSLLSALGVLMNRQCAYGRAAAYLEQSLAICREIGDRRGQLIALTNLAIILYCLGDYSRALSLAQEARQVGHEIGDRRYEAWALHTLGRLSVRLGRVAQAETLYAQALGIGRELGDRQLEAVLLCSSGLLAHERGDDPTALLLAHHSLQIVRELDEPVDVAYALTSLGHALAGLGRPDEARAAYQEAVGIRRQLGQLNLAAESSAGLAWIALTQAEIAQARAYVEEILPILETGALEGTEQPLWVYLVCFRVLSAAGDRRRDPVLASACDLLQAQSARIADQGLRRSFLENVGPHREIMAAYEQRRTSGPILDGPTRQIQVPLPRAGAPLGHALRDGELVLVTWTVAAAEDEAVAGKAARRRHCLLRLLREAHAQGAAPTHRHLADALGVSRRTIERDVAALREPGRETAGCTEQTPPGPAA